MPNIINSLNDKVEGGKIQKLISDLEGENKDGYQAAATALAESRDPGAIKALADFSKSSMNFGRLREAAREAATEALVAALRGDQDASVIEALMHVFHDRHATIKPTLLNAFTKLDVNSLLNAFNVVFKNWLTAKDYGGENQYGEVQTTNWKSHLGELLGVLIDGLVGLGDSAVEALIIGLKDKDEGIRYGAARALWGKTDLRIVEPLIAALKDSSSYVRSSAVFDLWKPKDERAVEPLIAALADEDDGVRFGAALSLGRLGDKRAVEPLIRQLADSHSNVRGAAISALGRLGDARAIEPLTAHLKDNDNDVREIARAALEELKKAGKTG